jgi:hypothetical protein
MHKKSFLATAALFAMICTAPAQQPTSDWKLYGASTAKGQELSLFFLASELRRLPDNHVQVWTKGLSSSKISKAKLSQDTIKRLAMKALVYEPPVGRVHALTQDSKLDTVVAEEVADEGLVEPTQRVLYEFDCAEHMVRVLSVYVSLNGSPHSSDTAGAWAHTPPESNGAALQQLVCPAASQ